MAICDCFKLITQKEKYFLYFQMKCLSLGKCGFIYANNLLITFFFGSLF